MIIMRQWKSGRNLFGLSKYRHTGWFLFGFLPLYIKKVLIEYDVN